LSGVSISYIRNEESVTAPTNAGSYAVVASLDHANYEAADATGTLVISKARATIALSNLSATYTGQPHAAAATTSPANLSGVSITYAGSTTPPTNVGNYVVVASLDNANYEAQEVSGNLTIVGWTNTGFFAPVDKTVPYATPVYNTTKGGNTVPLKFEVFTSDKREITSTIELNAKLVQASMNCVSGASFDEIEAPATGSTSLRYDTANGGQFIYNWKTPTGAACFKITVTLADGSAMHAYFQTRK